jgi:hypothetical protein
MPRRRKRTRPYRGPTSASLHRELVDGRVRDDDATCWSSGEEGGCTFEDTAKTNRLEEHGIGVKDPPFDRKYSYLRGQFYRHAPPIRY